MNTTETRLQDALRSVAETVDTADVPELALPGRTPRRLRTAALSLAAVAAAAAVTATLVLTPFGSRQAAPPAAGPLGTADLTVYFCVASSFNPSCGHRDATEDQKDAVKDALRRLPAKAKKVIYVTRDLAARNFDADITAPRIGSGDLPDSFRVTLAHPADAQKAGNSLVDMPGVDMVDVEKTGVVLRRGNGDVPQNPWRGKGDIAVFMCSAKSRNSSCEHTPATNRQVEEIMKAMLGRAKVRATTVQTADVSLTWLRHQNPALAGMTGGDVPDALLLDLFTPNPVDVIGVARALRRYPGVDSVSVERLDPDVPAQTRAAEHRLLGS